MNILLTNDDGIWAPGLRSLHQALTSAGHQVTVVA
ncbi:MAG: 5'/3'-nucleotidase SurE, partial [Desulfovermiculus sp.]